MSERLAALAFLAASGAYLLASLVFPMGTGARPGPGFFPIGIGVFLCAVAAVFVAVAFRRAVRGSARSGRPGPASGRAPVAVTAGALVGFCLLLPWTGYLVSSFLLVAVLLRGLGGARWPGAIAAAALSSGASYVVFAVLLSVPLPRGVLLD
jgi:hypothetical protein